MSSIETYYGHTHKCKQPSNKTNNYQNNTNNTYNNNNNTRSINQSINEHNQNNSTLALGGECCGADSCCCLTSSISQSINQSHTTQSSYKNTHNTPTHQRTYCALLWQSVNQSITQYTPLCSLFWRCLCPALTSPTTRLIYVSHLYCKTV